MTYFMKFPRPRTDNKKCEATTTCGSSQNESGNKQPDWGDVLVQASIAAMQGMQESGFRIEGIAAQLMPKKLASVAVGIGKALVEELKREIGE